MGVIDQCMNQSFNLDDHSTVADVQAAISALSYSGGGTGCYYFTLFLGHSRIGASRGHLCDSVIFLSYMQSGLSLIHI